MTSTNDCRVEPLLAAFEREPESIKEASQARLAAVHRYHDLMEQGAERKSAVAQASREHSIGLRTLNEYLALIRGQPRDLWLALLRPRPKGRPPIADISAEVWELLQADYLRIERPSARSCIDRIRRIDANERKGWTIPSDRTLLRRLNGIARPVRILARQGAKALREAYPSQQRSKAHLRALEIVNADGYKHNLWVRFPDGEIVRAKTFFWQDVYSGKVLAWRTDKTEHTDMVRLGFADLLRTWGLPDAAVLDNTMAAANKTMSGGLKHRFRFKVREEEVDGIFKNCGIALTWATPGHGQAKPIERAFGTGGIGEYVDKAPELKGAWTGANPLDKPDYGRGKVKAIELAELQAVIAREIAAWNARENRRGAMTHGRSVDAVFEESYRVAPIRRATEEQLRLWLLASEPVRVARDGAITLDAGRIVGEKLSNRYWSSELFEFAARMVAARFDPQRLHEGVHVYTADGRYIGFAECDRAAGFNDRDAARERSRARNIFARNAKAMHQAQVRMDALDVGKALAGKSDGTIPAPAVPRRSVIRPSFSDPLERQRYQPIERSPEEQAQFARLENEWSKPRPVNVMELQTDAAKHSHWQTLDERRKAGDQLSDKEAEFWSHWQKQGYFVDITKAEVEFEKLLAARRDAASSS